MTVRIGSLWDSTQQVLAGRAGMLAPFAAIGFVLPSVMQLLLLPGTTQTPGAAMGIVAIVVMLVSIGLSLWGQMAIMALATHPATTQGAAAHAAMARLPATLGIVAIMVLVAAAVMVVPVVVLGMSGYDFEAAMAAAGNPARMPAVPAGAALFVLAYMLVTGVVAIWLGMRLIPVYAVVLNERRGLGAFRRSIALTRRMTWRLLGVTLLFGIVLTVATLAAQGVTGIAFRLILGAERIAWAQGIAALAGSIVTAGFMTLAYVFVARLYVATADRAASPPAMAVMEDGAPSL
ncbi:hypothetical protein RN629_00245 [Sphingomonadaceae bacterium jetA1]|jgi:hypothetical protein|uniref:hypothetical protein n=1 Tax=Facivitalis istanbulensis TaxID=3075838 RepID=UPI003496C601